MRVEKAALIEYMSLPNDAGRLIQVPFQLPRPETPLPVTSPRPRSSAIWNHFISCQDKIGWNLGSLVRSTKPVSWILVFLTFLHLHFLCLPDQNTQHEERKKKCYVLSSSFFESRSPSTQYPRIIFSCSYSIFFPKASTWNERRQVISEFPSSGADGEIGFRKSDGKEVWRFT